eukprot:gene4275-5349_t
MTIVETIEYDRRKKEENFNAKIDTSSSKQTTEQKDLEDILTLSPEQRVKKSDEFKAQANTAFSQQKFDQAVELYSRAIRYHATAILYSNRSFSNFKKEYFVDALQDAIKANEMDPDYIKAYYRLGSAHLALGNYQDAKNNFLAVCKKVPNDVEGRQKLKMCNDLIKNSRFDDALFVQPSNPFEGLDYESMVVEPTYSGPHFNGDKITKEFVQELVLHMKNQKFLHKKYLIKILKLSYDMMKELPSLVDIDHETTLKITICGDTHGQYYDLLNIFEINGYPSESAPYLFNGDFVDRGSFSLEVIVCLLAYKLLYPNHMHLTRGNHESVDMNRFYGFQGEVVQKYSEMVYDLFAELFSWFPLAFVLDSSFMVVHGGLFGKDGVTLDDIRKINRHSPDAADNELLQCLLWSDPQPTPGRAPSSRGVGIYFGPDVTRKFLKDNNLCTIIRSHEVKEKGYQIDDDGSLITVFSAPNYCDQGGNLGSFIKISEEKIKITTFSHVAHPDIGPMHYCKNFMG